MSKVDKILKDELDPEDLNPSPRGGKSGRNGGGKSGGKSGGKIMQGLGERVGFAGIVLATVLAAGVGLVGCRPDTTPPKPTSSCEEDQPCWDCSKDGNKRCGDDPPAVKASCAEPASWCGGVTEAVQR
jgi:hypothetical protein